MYVSSCRKHLHDRIISLRGEVRVNKTSLAPLPLFIDVLVPCQSPIHHCHLLARYKNVSLTHHYITVMYWYGTRTYPLHTNTSLSCTGTVQERVPYTPIHHCHVLAHGSDVLVCKWHVLVPCQYMTVMYWCVRDTFLYRASTWQWCIGV
jgi:hypothetical protein